MYVSRMTVAKTVIESLSMTQYCRNKAQRGDEPGEEGGEGQGDEYGPGGRLHHEIRSTHRLGILTAQADDGEGREDNDCTEPPG